MDSANKTQTSNPTVFAPRHEISTHALGDIFQRRKLGTTWEPDLENSSVKLPFVSKLWHLAPHDLRMEWSSILSPDRKWSSPTPKNERVGFVAWYWLQHFHREGLSADVRPHWSLLASLLPRGTVIRDTRLEMTSLVFVPIWLSSVQASQFAVAARGRDRHL